MIVEFALNGPWMFKGFPERNGEELKAYDPQQDTAGWLSAEVPGTIHTDLMANNVIPDPFRDLNEQKVQWVSGYEWWYRKVIDLPSDLVNKEVIQLVFDGLDTFATIWVNGVLIGKADDMFIPWYFDIKNVVKPGRNVIAIKFASINKIVSDYENKYTKYTCLFPKNCSVRAYVRKAQYSFGWDWGPTLPTSGIWRQARILGYNEAKLGYVTALPLKVSNKDATMLVTGEINASKILNLRIKFKVEGFGQKIEHWTNVSVNQGRNFVENHFEIQDPKLWWPRGYGKPCLYDVTLELFSDNSLLDSKSTKMGIRTVELTQEPDSEGVSFVLKVNGIPVFCKGANWIPADSFLPRVTVDRYRRLLRLCAQANVNMIRVWGGGIYENDEFYNLCDEFGILVWQDFMYACSAYPEEDWFLKQAKNEAEEIVLRLRGHPCIALWCGNNENQWLYFVLWKKEYQMERLLGLPIYDVILPEVFKRLDPTRPYRPSTPFGGQDFSGRSEGHRHNWEVWSQGLDYTAYLEDTGRFLTEFGWQAPPNLELLEAYLDKEDLDPYSQAFEAHEKQIDGLERLRDLLALHYPVSENLKQFVLYSQLNQGEALKTAVTHWRSRMFRTSGCLIWQLNDCWPVISWSLIDYGLNPKPSYFFVKRVFRPIIAPLIVKEGKAQVYIVNETDRSLEAALSLEIMKFTGEKLYNNKTDTIVPAFTSQLAIQDTIDTMVLHDDCILVVTLESNGKLLYQDIKTIGEPKDLKLLTPIIKNSIRKVGPCKFILRLESDIYAKTVWLKLEGLRVKFSDNFFDLVPKRVKTVKCISDQDLSLVEFEKRFLFEAYPYLK